MPIPRQETPTNGHSRIEEDRMSVSQHAGRALRISGKQLGDVVKLGMAMSALGLMAWWLLAPRVEAFVDTRAVAAVVPHVEAGHAGAATAVEVAAVKVEAHDAAVKADVALKAVAEVRPALGVMLCPAAGGRPGRAQCFFRGRREPIALDALDELRDAIEERR